MSAVDSLVVDVLSTVGYGCTHLGGDHSPTVLIVCDGFVAVLPDGLRVCCVFCVGCLMGFGHCKAIRGFVESVVSDGCMSCSFAFVGFGEVRYTAVGGWLG